MMNRIKNNFSTRTVASGDHGAGGNQRLFVTVAVAIFAAVLLVVAVLAGAGVIDISKLFGQRQITDNGKEDPNMIDGKDALTVARERALQWQADAMLAFLSSGAVNTAGRSTEWEMIFVSNQKKGTGFRVRIRDQQIVSAEEIPYVGAGATVPDGLISQEEAIARVRAMKGFENAVILGVEAVYGPGDKIWYWGVKTDKGVVSVKANR